MENLFFVNRIGAIPHGVFGTLAECANWIFKAEGSIKSPDNDDPLEYIGEFDDRYEVRPAQAALHLLVTVEEARPLFPPGAASDREIQAWLIEAEHDVTTLRAFADILYDRKHDVRMRGSVHKLAASPFTNDQFDQLLRQLA